MKQIHRRKYRKREHKKVKDGREKLETKCIRKLYIYCRDGNGIR
jgi:hypothetical protein